MPGKIRPRSGHRCALDRRENADSESRHPDRRDSHRGKTPRGRRGAGGERRGREAQQETTDCSALGGASSRDGGGPELSFGGWLGPCASRTSPDLRTSRRSPARRLPHVPGSPARLRAFRWRGFPPVPGFRHGSGFPARLQASSAFRASGPPRRASSALHTSAGFRASPGGSALSGSAGLRAFRRSSGSPHVSGAVLRTSPAPRSPSGLPHVSGLPAFSGFRALGVPGPSGFRGNSPVSGPCASPRFAARPQVRRTSGSSWSPPRLRAPRATPAAPRARCAISSARRLAPRPSAPDRRPPARGKRVISHTGVPVSSLLTLSVVMHGVGTHCPEPALLWGQSATSGPDRARASQQQRGGTR